MMTGKLAEFLGVALSAVLLAGCGSADPTLTPAESTSTPIQAPPTFEEQWEALQTRAREEGRLVLVTGGNASRALTPPVREAFGKRFGIEEASTMLDHSSVKMTEVDAERDREQALEIARQVG